MEHPANFIETPPPGGYPESISLHEGIETSIICGNQEVRKGCTSKKVKTISHVQPDELIGEAAVDCCSESFPDLGLSM